jgi:hypothetical protein
VQSSVVIWRKGAEGRVWSGVGGRELDSAWTAAGYTSVDGSSLRHEFQSSKSRSLPRPLASVHEVGQKHASSQQLPPSLILMS